MQHIDYEEYYTTRDPDLLASNFTTNLAFLTNNWRHMLGRPTITLMATHYMLGNYIYQPHSQPNNLSIKPNPNRNPNPIQ